jgi:ribonuclease Z
MKIFLQILGTDKVDSNPSFLLFFDEKRYLFNAPEGIMRFCTEHKIKLSKINHIFLNQISSNLTGIQKKTY